MTTETQAAADCLLTSASYNNRDTCGILFAFSREERVWPLSPFEAEPILRALGAATHAGKLTDAKYVAAFTALTVLTGKPGHEVAEAHMKLSLEQAEKRARAKRVKQQAKIERLEDKLAKAKAKAKVELAELAGA